MYPLEVYYPDDPTRLCRPKAGQSLVEWKAVSRLIEANSKVAKISLEGRNLSQKMIYFGLCQSHSPVIVSSIWKLKTLLKLLPLHSKSFSQEKVIHLCTRKLT